MDAVLKRLVEDATSLGRRPSSPAITRVVQAATADADYWDHVIERMGNKRGEQLHYPDRGVRVVVTHRRHGAMSAIHSHQCWAALTPLRGIETHRRYRAIAGSDFPAEMTEERHLNSLSGDIVTLLPPDDIHSHGHLIGTGDAAYTLIVLGDAQERFLRYEYDALTGHPRPLHPGDMGTPNLPAGVAAISPL